MSITTIEAQFVTALNTVIENTTSAQQIPMWPIRWPNEAWVIGTGGVLALTQDNAPADLNGFPAPFVEAEVIGGKDASAVGMPNGSLQSCSEGLFRVYLVSPLGSGRGPLNLLADAVHDAFKLKTIYYNPPERLTAMHPRIDDGVAEHIAQTNVRIDAAVPAPWKGDRFVRQISINYYFDYNA